MENRANQHWTPAETKLLLKLRNTKTDNEIAKIMGRSPRAVHSKFMDISGNAGRECPRCGKRNRVSFGVCLHCGLRLHTTKNCKGCREATSSRWPCAVYKNPADPILEKDGTCLGYKKVAWEDTM